jgi:type IV secretory pathway TraG/TraD family ATPase VirD4
MPDKQPASNERLFEYMAFGGVLLAVAWLAIAESVAIIAGGHHWLPSLASAPRAAYYALSRGNPVAGWSAADQHDLPSSRVFIVVALIEIAVLTAGTWALLKKGVFDTKTDKKSRAPSRSEIKSHLSISAIRERTGHLREDIDAWKAHEREIGLFLGTETTSKQKVYAAADDSVLMVGPPGSGKTASFIAPAVVEAPGAAIVTSTREEIIQLTATRRLATGHPVWVFAPQLDTEMPAGVLTLTWNPLEGCQSPLTAIVRAQALVKAGAGFGSGSTSNSDYWANSAVAVLRCYLLAAATGHKTIEDVCAWSAAPTAPEPVAILDKVMPAWGNELLQMGTGSGATVSSIWSGVRRALDSFADPRILAACSDANFDIDQFLEDKGTAYFVGSGSTQMSVAPLVATIVEAITERARQPKGRGHLTTPLSLILDEAANIAPLPTLPALLSDGGGSGIQTLVVLQSLAQGRHRWSDAEMDAMWDASTIKIILAGMSHAQDLQAISQLCGEIEEERTTKTSGDGVSSSSTSPAMVPAWPPEQIRGLQVGHALMLHRRLKPVEIIAKPYWERQEEWDRMV